MLLNESPKSNPVPKWNQTIREFILLGIIPGGLAAIYLFYPENKWVGLIGLGLMLLALRTTIVFVVKVIRINIESWKRKQ